MNYVEALARIHAMEGRPWRQGLDRMRAFVDRAGLGASLYRRNYVHVAGTNGKGTTTAFAEAILRHQGWRTGAFFSPYVVDYRERIQANGQMISPCDLAASVERLAPLADSLSDTPYGGATKFELEVALGLAHWEASRSDWVALEVGLGGRLDATNVVVPRACAIVSIGLDHTAILGRTLEAIATEKAGIVKAGIPVIVGEMPFAAEETIVRIAEEQGAPVWRVGREVVYGPIGDRWEVHLPGQSFRGLRPTLGGARTPHNMAVALAVCWAGGAIRELHSVGEAVSSAWLPGRYEMRRVQGRDVVFDGAHNVDAAVTLAASFAGRRVHLVTNMLAGHEVIPFYDAFVDTAIAAEIAPIDSPRAMSVEAAAAAIRSVGIATTAHGTLPTAFQAALDDGGGSTILVTGSNYLVGEALRYVETLSTARLEP